VFGKRLQINLAILSRPQTLSAWITLSLYSLADGFRFTGHEARAFGSEGSKEKLDDDYKDWHYEVDSLDNSIKDDKNSSTDSLANSVEKRHGNSKHLCSCHSIAERQDFGEGTFPRYLQSRVCDKKKIAVMGENCHHGGHCKEFHHNILLLKLKSGAQDEERQHELPRDIRKNYFWFVRSISVDCRCTLP
jgi:hypothetical protein